jgi:hypothetical protein
MTFNFGWIPLIQQELRRFFASKAQGALADSALQSGNIGSSVQAYDADLAAIAALVSIGTLERTGAGAFETFTTTAYGKTLLSAANASAARTALSLSIGSNVQAWDTDLDAVAGLSSTGFVDRTGAGAFTVINQIPTARVADGAITAAKLNSAVINRFRQVGGISVADFSSTGNLTLTGDSSDLYYRNFTLNTGHTMTVDKFVKIHCSGDVVINGTIVVTQICPGGVGEPYFDLPTTFFGGYISGVGLGQARNTYSWQAQPYGSGGTSGYGRSMTVGNAATIRGGAAGGGGFIIEAAGTITVAAGASITAAGANALASAISSGNGIIAGAGGGSGGFIGLFAGVAIVVAGTLSVVGGNGGNAVNVGISGIASGGGAGGGGRVFLAAPSINTTGSTITLTAGTAGTNAGSGSITLGPAPGGSFGGAGGGFGLSAAVGHLRTLVSSPVE